MEESEGKQMGSDGVRDGKGRKRGCTMTVGASQPSCPVNDLQRLGGMPLSLGSCALSDCQSAGGRRWRESA